MKVYEFEVNYDANVCVCIGGHINDFKKFLRDRYAGRIPSLWSWDRRVYVKDIHSTDGYSVFVNYNPPKHDEIFYMWIEDMSKHLQHEITHTTGNIMFVRGYEYSYQSEENWAYMNQEITDKLQDLLNKENDSKN
jgi:hypothetical protein